MKIGDLAELTEIINWDPDILLNAFLELSEEKNPEKRWKTIDYGRPEISKNSNHKKTTKLENEKTNTAKIKEKENIVWIKLNKNLPKQTLQKLRTIKFFFNPVKKSIFGPQKNEAIAKKILKL